MRVLRLSGWLVLALALVAPAATPQTGGSRFDLTYLVHGPEGPRELPAFLVDGQDMLALNDLAGIFGLTVREDTLAGGVTVSYRDQTIVLTPGQELVSVAGRLVSLPAGLTRDARGWLVPVEFLSRALALVYDGRIEVRRGSRRILMGDVRVPRVAVRYEPAGPGARLTIEMSPTASHSVTREGDRLIVRVDADALEAELPAAPGGGLIEDIRTLDAPLGLAIALGPRVESFRVVDQPIGDSLRIVINLLPHADTAAGPTPPPVMPVPAPETAPPAPLGDLGPRPGLRTVVVDPGHGGVEDGARGPGGTLEKEVTLVVARRLASALESRLGLRVILTRTADETVRLDERAAIANNNKADLFISLHTNASLSPAAAGAEVFYLNLDEYGDTARRIAASEPDVLPVFGGGAREIEVIPWEMAQARHIGRSAAFARLVESHLRSRVPMSLRAVQQAPFRVLVGANMPAVLVEMGFITNPEQERQLQTDAFQSRLVQAIVDAVVAFRNRLDIDSDDPPIRIGDQLDPDRTAPGGPTDSGREHP